MAHDSNATLVPFIVTGKYGFFRRVRIEFLKQLKVKDNLEEANQDLMNIISEGLIKNGKEFTKNK